MTISVDIGKFTAKLKHDGCIGYRSREVELDVQWHSCGVYQVSYWRPMEAADHHILVTEDWYPPSVSVTFTPEQIEKVVELYTAAPKHARANCYKPFYEDYGLDRCMIDMAQDELFQAFVDPLVERVYLVNHVFSHGAPTSNSQVLGLTFDELKGLKEFLDSKKGEIFYSGCQVSWPSKNVSDLQDSISDND